jgi:hypothetical protein
VLEVKQYIMPHVWVTGKRQCKTNPLQYTVTQGQVISSQFLIVETPLEVEKVALGHFSLRVLWFMVMHNHPTNAPYSIIYNPKDRQWAH